MSRFGRRMLTMVTVAALALTAAGFTGAAAATVASRATRPAVYSDQLAGYQAAGRWFRYVATTVTVPPRTLPHVNSGSAFIGLNGRYPAWINVDPGGGPDSVGYEGFNVGTGPFGLAPRVGDRLAISIYYDQHGYDYFTAADLTQHTTQTVRQAAGGINPVFVWASLYAVAGGTVPPPAADTLLWQFTGSHLTTYDGVHGAVIGPWQTTMLIKTSDGTPAGAVLASPSRLSNGSHDFGVTCLGLRSPTALVAVLRALPGVPGRS
jgi:hypothetical protein